MYLGGANIDSSAAEDALLVGVSWYVPVPPIPIYMVKLLMKFSVLCLSYKALSNNSHETGIHFFSRDL